MPLNVALRKFKQKVDDSGVLEDLKEKMFFEKPTTVRKRKAGAAKSRWNKKLRDQSLPKKMF
jgi:small subunit ribosomal protein S21